MRTRRIATVFGGAGFIGRYVVQRLARLDYVVRVGTRDPERVHNLLQTQGKVGQIVALYGSITEPDAVARAVDGADVVVNLVGILSEARPGAFDRVHGEGAGLVARRAAEAGVLHLAHLSAIGADPSGASLYARSKAAGEAAVREHFPNATILRPSVVFGAEDQFLNRFARMAQLLPFMPVFHGDTKFQPVYVGDVADAVIRVVERDDTAALAGGRLVLPGQGPAVAAGGTVRHEGGLAGAPAAEVDGKLFELGGPRVLSFREILDYVLTVTHRHRRLVNVSDGLARLQASLGEKLPGKPFTRDQLLLLQRDNVVSPGVPGLRELGIEPKAMEVIVPSYLSRYRPGGTRRGLAVV